MDSTMLPWSPQAVQLCSGFRSVSEIIEATGRFYEVYGGTILKQSLASIRGTFQHPDLPSTEVKVKVFVDRKVAPTSMTYKGEAEIPYCTGESTVPSFCTWFLLRRVNK